MKHPCAALLAVAVWHLVMPPKLVYYGASIWNMDASPSQWVVLKSFESAKDCEQWKADADQQANQVRPTFDVDRCVASDDDLQSVE